MDLQHVVRVDPLRLCTPQRGPSGAHRRGSGRGGRLVSQPLPFVVPCDSWHASAVVCAIHSPQPMIPTVGGPGGPGPVDHRDGSAWWYAFCPDEVRRMVELACSTLEQLVVMLFLTTGLRLGGLARLQLHGKVIRSAPTEGAILRTPVVESDVPPELTTVEKQNKHRRVRPTTACRVLLT